MDIAKVRKKLKELKTGIVQGNRETLQTKEDEVTKKEELAKETNDKINEVSPPPVLPPVQKIDDSTSKKCSIEREKIQAKEIEIIAFKVGDEDYAVRLSEMQEIIRYQNITSVPRSPEYLKGVTFLRGKILPVVDLCNRLGIKGIEGERKKIIVLATPKEPMGALISSLLNVLRFPETELLQPPATLSDKEKRFIEGIVKMGDRFISLLNVEEVFNKEAS